MNAVIRVAQESSENRQLPSKGQNGETFTRFDPQSEILRQIAGKMNIARHSKNVETCQSEGSLVLHFNDWGGA